jgi:hypothetical protein
MTEPVDRPQQYANQETIDLSNQLLPTILEGKTKLEIVEILEDPENQNLVDLLRHIKPRFTEIMGELIVAFK